VTRVGDQPQAGIPRPRGVSAAPITGSFFRWGDGSQRLLDGQNSLEFGFPLHYNDCIDKYEWLSRRRGLFGERRKAGWESVDDAWIQGVCGTLGGCLYPQNRRKPLSSLADKELWKAAISAWLSAFNLWRVPHSTNWADLRLRSCPRLLVLEPGADEKQGVSGQRQDECRL
jgi:hypothetical protein